MDFVNFNIYPVDFVYIQSILWNCVRVVLQWCASWRLQLNTDKTKLHIQFKIQSQQTAAAWLWDYHPDFRHSWSWCTPWLWGRWNSAHVKLLQSASTSSVVCARYVVVSDKELTTRLVLAHAISTLDYFSSVLASLPYSKIEPLQRIQNAAAWLLFNWAVVC